MTPAILTSFTRLPKRYASTWRKQRASPGTGHLPHVLPGGGCHRYGVHPPTAVSFEAWAPAAPRGCSQRGGSPLPSNGRPVQKRRSGHARAVPGCHHHPAARPTYPGTVRLCQVESLSAEGERTLMGPAPQRPRRPQKRLSPHAGPSAETNERATGWKVGPHDPAGAEDERRVTPGQSNDMAETSGTGLAPVGSPPEESNQQARRPVPATDATRAAFAQANRCTQTRRTGGGRHRMTGATADRRVGPLIGNDATSDPNRPLSTP